MRKLKLDVDSLAVQSFDTSATLPGAGTVRGNDSDSLQGGSGCPIDTCTCGETSCCPPTAPGGPDAQVAFPGYGDSDCLATDGVCTCQPIETCSCAATN